MGTLRKLAHLREQLGEKRFEDLINPENTGKVKRFCDKLFRDSLPQEMTVGDRTYEIINFLEDSEESVRGEAMVARATIGYAHLGEKHGRHLLEHQDEIPIVLRDRVVFVFTDWRNPDHNKLVSCVYWHADHWRQRWDNLDNNFHSTDRILRLKKG